MADRGGWTIALAAGAWLGGTHHGVDTGLGAVLNAAVIAEYLPAVLETHGARSTTGSLGDVGPRRAQRCELWISYGGLVGDWALIGYGTAVGAAAFGVTVGVMRTRRTHALPASPAKPRETGLGLSDATPASAAA